MDNRGEYLEPIPGDDFTDEPGLAELRLQALSIATFNLAFFKGRCNTLTAQNHRLRQLNAKLKEEILALRSNQLINK